MQFIDGGDGQAFPQFAAAYPQAVAAVLRALADTTGVDVTALLAKVPTAATVSVTAGIASAPIPTAPAPGGVR